MAEQQTSLSHAKKMGDVRIEGSRSLESRLIKACLEGELREARRLIADEKADFNCVANVVFKDLEGQPMWYNVSPFLATCWSLCEPLAAYLAAKGADVNHASTGSTSPIGDSVFPGWTALHISARLDNVAMYNFLVAQGVIVTVDDNGMSPLIVAALYKAENVFNILVANSTDYGRENKINAFELLGTKYFPNDVHKLRLLWQQAMSGRKKTPILFKEEVDSYGNQPITEVDSHEELTRLFHSGSNNDFRIQIMMIKERVCGKASFYVTRQLITFATVFNQSEQREESIQLLFRALTNLPGKLTIGKLQVYLKLKDSLAYYLPLGRPIRAPVELMVFRYINQGLEIAFADFQLGISLQTDEDAAKGFLYRKELLHVIYSLLELSNRTSGNVPTVYLESFSKSVKAVRGKKNETLLHIACSPETNDLDDIEWMAVVEVLLAAKCDKDAADDEGQTPLQLARRHKDQRIIRKLEESSLD